MFLVAGLSRSVLSKCRFSFIKIWALLNGSRNRCRRWRRAGRLCNSVDDSRVIVNAGLGPLGRGLLQHLQIFDILSLEHLQKQMQQIVRTKYQNNECKLTGWNAPITLPARTMAPIGSSARRRVRWPAMVKRVRTHHRFIHLISRSDATRPTVFRAKAPDCT